MGVSWHCQHGFCLTPFFWCSEVWSDGSLDCIWSPCGRCTLVTIWLVQQITVESRFLGEWEGERSENISWSEHSDACLSSDISSASASTTSSHFSYSGNDYSSPSLKKAVWSFYYRVMHVDLKGKVLWKCLHWFLIGQSYLFSQNHSLGDVPPLGIRPLYLVSGYQPVSSVFCLHYEMSR